MNYLKNVNFIKSAYSKKDIIQDDLPIIAIAGKSNVGKSSFINSLCNNKSTAKVGSTPGKTRSINYFLVNNEFYIVDLPGYGYSTMSQKEKENINALTNYFLETNKNIKHIFLLVDCRHLPTTEDKQMYNWLEAMDKDFSVILNKVDKLSATKQEQSVKDIQKSLFSAKNLILFSSENKVNLDKILNIVNENSKR